MPRRTDKPLRPASREALARIRETFSDDPYWVQQDKGDRYKLFLSSNGSGLSVWKGCYQALERRGLVTKLVDGRQILAKHFDPGQHQPKQTKLGKELARKVTRVNLLFRTGGEE